MYCKNLLSIIALAAMTMLFSCQSDDKSVTDNQISEDVLNQIQALGFGRNSVVKVEDGYLVEGDILLTEKNFKDVATKQFLRVGEEEQYRTTNLVTKLPRVITVSISNRLPASYVAALDETISRYNALGLKITFQRVSGIGHIDLVKGNGSYLASAGFPTSSGEPHNQVKVNSTFIGKNPDVNYLATILAHEIGHCIGFRHTDYMDRSYSCGGSTANEGASTVGAIHIPGTPTTADPNSWMLACIATGKNRPFNANDKTALSYLYK